MYLGHGHIAERPLVLPAKARADVVHVGEKDELVGIAVVAKELGGVVLLDDGGNAHVAALVVGVPDDGDASSATGDDDEVVVEEVEDALRLHDAPGTRAGHHASVATTVIDEPEVGMLRRLGVRLRLGEMRADLLGRVDERGIVGLHLDLRDDGGHVPFLLALVHFGADGLLEVVTDIALRHRPALWQIDDGNVLVNGCGDAKGTLDHEELLIAAGRLLGVERELLTIIGRRVEAEAVPVATVHGLLHLGLAVLHAQTP